jgi:hypothetical protein
MTSIKKLLQSRKANRKYYLANKEKEKKRTSKWRKDNWSWWKSYYKKNKKKIAAASRKSAYGITHEEYEKKLKKQKGKCAICEKQMRRPDVDHNHTTGKVRDLLCRPCNTLIGLSKESMKILRNAIQYLKKHKS